MRCPYCSTDNTRVAETRMNEAQGTIRRRRECLECRRRFNTFERYEEQQIYVIKKDQRRELFNAEKMLNGITHACQKRPVSREAIENVVFEIERSLRDALQDEISSAHLGDMVMRHLQILDEVAYVRFASVYKEFHDVSSFMLEIERLVGHREEVA